MYASAIVASLLAASAVAVPLDVEPRDEVPRTDVHLSDQMVDWGCDLNPGRMLHEAFDVLCPKDHKACSGQKTWTEQHSYVASDNGGNYGGQTVKISMRGSWPNPEAREHLVEMLDGVANPKTVKLDERERVVAPPGTAVPVKTMCPMMMFTNYIRIERWEEIGYDVEISIDIDGGSKPYNGCEMMGHVNDAAGMFSGITGVIKFTWCEIDENINA